HSRARGWAPVRSTGRGPWTPRDAQAIMPCTMPSPTRAAMADKRRSGPPGPMLRTATPPDLVLILARVALVATLLLFIPGLLEQFEAAKAFAVRVLGIGLLALLATRVPGSRARGLQPMDVAALAWLA